LLISFDEGNSHTEPESSRVLVKQGKIVNDAR
jgi:hypothetical protein